ncbi:MAG: translation initiation factor IF-2, partial [Deltaproteobacteria bacterium]|nr:translation initiation factor IF-2 [Deltaproteobacteria bacterium]
MSKVRVYEVAREVGLPNRELVQKISALGIPVRNHMSALDPTEVERVKRALDKEKQDNVVEERIRPTVVRRRVVRKKKEPVVEAAPDSAPGNGAASAFSQAVTEPMVQVAPDPEPRRAPKPIEVTPDVRPGPVPEPKPQPVVQAKPVVKPEPVVEAKPEVKPQPVAEPVAEAKPEAKREPVVEAKPESKPEPAAEAKAEAPADAKSEAKAEPEAAAAGDGPQAPPPIEPPRRRPSQPPPAGETRGHAPLPPGVVQRGKHHAPSAGSTLSDDARKKIVEEHEQRRAGGPRRRELGRAALGPTGRKPGRMGGRPGRPGRRRLAPGKKGKQTEITVPSAQKRVIRIEDNIQLQMLAQRMSLKSTDVLMKLMQLGMASVHINSTLDTDTAKILANEFGYEVENVARSADEIIGDARGEFANEEGDRITRAPIVTVMGHVDHGKTSLLDKIRNADVASREAGGITQHIGAYRVETKRGPVVFLDTPGHEAFTEMRARGANATDIVILVCAADDGVMPQTKEAVSHAQAAEVPMVVAVNKIDRPNAKPEQVKNELAAEGLQPEEWGGETIFVDCSAITGEGVEKLLESVILTADLLELSANVDIPAEGTVLESYVDRGRGPVANVLVRDGTLVTGDYVVAGATWGRVRALTDDRGKQVSEAGPATPVEVLGLNDVPKAGDFFYKVTDAKKAQEVADAAKAAGPQKATTSARTLQDLHEMLAAGDVQELKLVIKADVQGSIEAIVKALTDLGTDAVKVNVIHTGVGGITENDVNLASASEAIVIGFNVRPTGQAAPTAKKQNVDVRMYKVIY